MEEWYTKVNSLIECINLDNVQFFNNTKIFLKFQKTINIKMNISQNLNQERVSQKQQQG